MDNYNNSWQENFEEKAKGDSPDLVPSERIFENVRIAVFEKKKRKRFLWIWLFVGLAVPLSGWAIYHYSQPISGIVSKNDELTQEHDAASDELMTKGNSSNAIAKPALEELSINTALENNRTDNTVLNVVEPLSEEGKQSSATMTQSENIAVENGRSNSSQISSNQLRTHNRKKNKTNQIDNANNLNSNSKIFKVSFDNLKGNKRADTEFIPLKGKLNSDKKTRSNFNESENNHNQLVESNTDQNQMFNLEQLDSKFERLTAALDYLEYLKLNGIEGMAPVKLDLLPTSAIQIIQDPSASLNWQFEFGVAYVAWSDQLNADYESALSPADFYLTSKSGYGFYGRLMRSLNNNISIGVGGGVNFVRSTSGHNSTSTYDITNEISPFLSEQNFTLGTPYGLLESSVSFKRNPSVIENQDLSLAIMTDHSFNVYFFDLSMHYNLLQLNSWKLGIMVGPRVNFFSQLENDVSIGLLNSSGITIDEFKLISNQQNVSSSFFSVFSRLDLSYQINARWNMALAGEWSEGLSPLFKSNSYGSNARVLNASLGIRVTL